jgi:hypothetical protein
MKGLGTCMVCGFLMHETISMKLPNDVSIADGILNRVTIPRWKGVHLHYNNTIYLQSTEVTHCHCNTHLRIESHTYLQPK